MSKAHNDARKEPSADVPQRLPSSSSHLPTAYPFSALLGQDTLQWALLLVTVDPGIGGLLIAGPRGTAKSTSARALAALMAPAPFVTLPLGASEAQLIGSIDLEAALRDSALAFAPGLLAKAHGGVLYVDEVNLLGDALADALLDVAASGVNVVERDGVSNQHAARFILIGTMNAEEGELRPQLSDRFGLALTLANYADAAVRQAIVRERLAFDLAPEAFVARYAAAQTALRRRVENARGRLDSLVFSDAVHRRVTEWCLGAGIDGVRGDLVMLRAARASAALDGVDAIRVSDVDRVAPLVLHHRRQAATIPGAPTPSQTGSAHEDAAETRGGAISDTADTARMPPSPAAPGHAGDVDTSGDARHDIAGGRPDGRQSPGQRRDEALAGGTAQLADGVESARNHTGLSDASPAGSSDAAGWGYLAPETGPSTMQPVPVAAVKQVRPYIPKKA